MNEFSRNPELSQESQPVDDHSRSPFVSLLSYIFFAIGGYFVANVFSYFGVAMLLGISTTHLALVLNNPSGYENAWTVAILTQAIAFTGSFLLTPLLYMLWIERRPVSSLNANKQLHIVPLLLVVFLVIALVPFNDLIIRWNNSIELPESLHWMRDMEDRLEELTKLLTNFTSIPRLLVGFVVIAVLPAIGEELAFRGLLQNKLFALTRNTHVAIWTTAILFSAIHVQFYGFVPRMLLGAVFGYLYVWSGNLWVPILAHFVNNAFTLLMMYLYQKQVSDYDVQNAPLTSWPLSLASLGVVIGILFYLKNYYANTRLVNRP